MEKVILSLGVLILIVVLLNSCVTTRNSDLVSDKNTFANRYVDQLEEKSTLLRAWLHYTVERTAGGAYIYKQYYPSNKQITHHITYKDDKLEERHGLYIEWYDNGSKWREGQYVNNKKEGEWKVYAHKTGLLYEYGNYKNGLKSGLWKTIDSVGDLRYEYAFQQGKYHGPFKTWDENGNPATKGEYVNNSIVSEYSYNDATNSWVEITKEERENSEKLPTFNVPECANEDFDIQKKCSDQKMLEVIYKNIRYPTFARQMSIEGTAITQFVIKKDGSIEDVIVLRGLCDEIKDECIRVTEMLQNWNPGEKNGKAVNVQFNIPIKFRLE